MRRSMNILALAERTARTAEQAGRGRTLSPAARKLIEADKNMVVLRGWLIQL
ncbi:hypothetical protein [Oceanicaulis sp. MMSF_3324]|uniref:hypothetical protein n=1 Tax=Oceanicaulis sp. MMSF_3324 TaxID=3046702 RepID=UPI00273EAAE7|nr:hypothetical protein [Oceanicaulis sp. MMSF_3324]